MKIPLTKPQTFQDIDPETIPFTFHKFRHFHIDKDSNLISDSYLLTDLVLKKYRNFFLTGLCAKNDITCYEHFKEEFKSLLIDDDPEIFTRKVKEQNVIEQVIKPVLNCLGWNKYKIKEEDTLGVFYKYSAEEICLNGDKADLMLCRYPGNAQDIAEYDQKKNKDKGKKLLAEIQKNVVTILEAKTQKSMGKKGVLKSKKKKEVDGKSASSQGPERQLIQYLGTYDKQVGILSEGRNWHLFYKDLSDSEVVRSFKFDLHQLGQICQEALSSNNEDEFELFARIFYFFFSKETHVRRGDITKSVLEEVFDDCDKYVNLMNEALKPKFLLAMGLLTNSIKRAYRGNKKLTEEEIKLIRSTSESLLFQLIFIKSCEMNGVLPLEQDAYNQISLKSIIECLHDFSPKNLKGGERTLGELEKLKRAFNHKFKFSYEGDEIHKQVIKLINTINNDMTSLKIESFKEDCFEQNEFHLLMENSISNQDFSEILFCLGYFEKDGESKEIPYNYLKPRQLGEIYETFLEFQLFEASEDVWWDNKRKGWSNLKKWTDYYDSSKEIRIRKGSLFFSPDNRERKVTGSYYTPHSITKYIVQSTLEPLLNQAKSYKEILKFKICDPAMGSGHFLNYSLHYLTKKYREHYFQEFKTAIDENYSQSSRDVLDSCIYGVDINPSAVKLAKISLWLSTAHRGRKLEALDDQIKCGNTLVSEEFNWSEEFPKVFKKKGFDAIIGNPPYIRTQNLDRDQAEYFKNKFTVASEGNFDIYALFIERAIGLLNDNGSLGYILPNKFFVVDSGRPLRKFIHDEKVLNEIIDFKDHQVFSSATTYTCIIALNKTPVQNVKYKSPDKEPFNLENIKSTEINRESLDCNSWNFINQPTSNVLDELSKCNETLGTVSEKIYQGIATSADSVYLMELIKEDKVYFWGKSKELNKTYKIERDICMPTLKGAEISRYSTTAPKNFVIFPYTAYSCHNWPPNGVLTGRPFLP